MAAFRDITPLLESNDLQGTVHFYTGILGFTLAGKLENNNEINWCSLNRDGVYIMFSKPNSIIKHNSIILSGSLYFYITDVDEYWQQVKDKAEIVYGLQNFEYGMREFAIKDNNGYVLNFGCEIKGEMA